uniref:Uncharacterized protein n=1 Tax=Timema genevievae TaxID=629358 RepID=A0A7R9PKC4_TIMGE|nr:unnamed protein product [Timema genevievae]
MYSGYSIDGNAMNKRSEHNYSNPCSVEICHFLVYLRDVAMDAVLECNRVHSQLLNTESSSHLLNNEALAPLINEYESFIKALQSQVEFYKEKESAVEMWRCSLKEVASLEEELKTYQDNRHVDLAQRQLEKVKEQYSEAITLLDGKLTWVKNELNKERSLRTELQGELSKLQLEHQSSTTRLHDCDKELCVTLKDKLELEKRTHVLENKITCLLEEKEALNNSSNKLEQALTRCHEQLEELSRRYGEACGKVEEALGLVDCACAERDRALLGEAAAKEEIAQSKVALSRLIEDAGEKIKEEAERLKEKYNRKIETVLYDMKKLDESLKEKTAELSREMKDHQSTQDQQQLELNEKDSHCTFLEHHLAGLKLDLKAALEARNEAIGHMERLSGEVNSLRQELDLTRHKSSTDLHAALQHAEDLECEKHLQERDDLIARLQEVQMKGVDMANELHHHLESQQQMKNKWQKAMRTLTSRFEKRIQELRCESSSLKEENQRLQSELKANRKYAVYKHLNDT